MIVHPKEKALRELDQLKRDRLNEMERLERGRWRSISEKGIEYNYMEGKIRVRGRVFRFDEIQNVVLDADEEVDRQVTHYEVEVSPEESHRKMNVGAGVVGTLVGGPIAGAAAAYAFGKTETKQAVVNTYDTVKETVYCKYIRVELTVSGFHYPFMLLDKKVDVQSSKYKSAMNSANALVDKLRKLQYTPVPPSYLKVEDERCILEYDSKIRQQEEYIKTTDFDQLYEEELLNEEMTRYMREQEVMEQKENTKRIAPYVAGVGLIGLSFLDPTFISRGLIGTCGVSLIPEFYRDVLKDKVDDNTLKYVRMGAPLVTGVLAVVSKVLL